MIELVIFLILIICLLGRILYEQKQELSLWKNLEIKNAADFFSEKLELQGKIQKLQNKLDEIVENFTDYRKKVLQEHEAIFHLVNESTAFINKLTKDMENIS